MGLGSIMSVDVTDIAHCLPDFARSARQERTPSDWAQLLQFNLSVDGSEKIFGLLTSIYVS